MHRRSARRSASLAAGALGAAALIVAVSACGLGADSPALVTIDGSIYTDFRVDLPCDEQQGPPELVGVGLTFREATTGGDVREGPEAVLGATQTASLVVLELPRTAETATWAHGGCRFAAPFRVRLPPAPAYTVAFTPADLGGATGTGFIGVDELEPASMSHEDLAAAQFVWTFEAPPSYVVP